MKGIAVTTLVLLIIGMVVIAIIGYLLYSTFISTGPTMSLESCRAQVVSACSNCKLRGWTGCTAPDCLSTYGNEIGFNTIDKTNCNKTGIV